MIALTVAIRPIKGYNLDRIYKRGGTMPSNAPIGFLDSGVGGVSVLNAARKALPNEDFILYGDSANAPYGTKSEEQVIDLVRNAAHILMQQGIKALVIACNTATGIALETMQKELPIPVVGILPAIRPAQKLRKEGDILVMGTPNTVKTAAVKKLMETDGEHVHLLGCPGLMEFVEKGELQGLLLHAHLQQLLAPYLDKQIDVVALGCTHYPFLQSAIAEFFPESTQYIDGSVLTLEELNAELTRLDLYTDKTAPGTTRFMTSNGEETIRLMEMLASR